MAGSKLAPNKLNVAGEKAGPKLNVAGDKPVVNFNPRPTGNQTIRIND